MIKFLLFIVFLCFSSIGFSQETNNKGTISGYMFGDLFYNAVRDSQIDSLPCVVNGGQKDINGIQIRRIYFTYDFDISENFISRFRLEADQNSINPDGRIGVFVKDAYLTWRNIFNGSDLTFGIQPTPAFEVSENIWGNRFLEKTIIDLRRIVTSRDLALSLKGKLDKDGLFKYWLMIGDGTGNKPETDKYKRYYAHFQYNPLKNFTMTFYFDFKSNPDIDNPNSIQNPKATLSNNDLTYSFFAGYKEDNKFTIGAEAFTSIKQNGNINGQTIKDKNAFGISIFGSYNLSKKLSAVGRYDFFDPNMDSDYKGDNRNLFLFSLNYSPVDKVTISPNIFIETYESLPGGKKYKPSVTPRLTLYYIFL